MPRKATRKKFTEDDQRKEKLKALLKQFDMEVDRRVYEMHRGTEQACAHIDSMFKLARLKLPSAVREQLWEDNKKEEDATEAPAPAASTVASGALSAVDAVLSEAERTVQQQKPAARGRPRGRATRNTPSASSAAGAGMVTPFQPLRPLHASTPAVTPKFDPLTVQRQAPSTIRRHRPREVLMSLKGSPVMPEAPAADATLPAEPKQLVQQTVELLRQDVELDDETKQLMASLRDQLIDLTATANMPI